MSLLNERRNLNGSIGSESPYSQTTPAIVDIFQAGKILNVDKVLWFELSVFK
jgi:hypothetical protein